MNDSELEQFTQTAPSARLARILLFAGETQPLYASYTENSNPDGFDNLDAMASIGNKEFILFPSVNGGWQLYTTAVLPPGQINAVLAAAGTWVNCPPDCKGVKLSEGWAKLWRSGEAIGPPELPPEFWAAVQPPEPQ